MPYSLLRTGRGHDGAITRPTPEVPREASDIAEMSASSAHISMHELEYSLTFLGLADDRRAAFSIV